MEPLPELTSAALRHQYELYQQRLHDQGQEAVPYQIYLEAYLIELTALVRSILELDNAEARIQAFSLITIKEISD
jgi:hypothetical protein